MGYGCIQNQLNKTEKNKARGAEGNKTTRNPKWMIQSGELASAVTSQSTCRELHLAGFGFCFVESLLLPGGMPNRWREPGFIAGVRACGTFLKGVQIARAAQGGGALMVACWLHI